MMNNGDIAVNDGEMDVRGRFIRSPILQTTTVLVLIVSGLIGFSLFWNLKNLEDQLLKQAFAEAEAHWNKDLSFRRWATRHGGVYVKPDERTPPNPYLGHLSERDLESTNGVKLTLMNPAYMMSQMTREFEELYSVKGKITARVLMNPANKPDDWELKALTLFEQGEKLFFEQQMIDGEPYLRYMRPMFMTQGCVKCHGINGFKDGDLRGGISVSVPLDPYHSIAAETSGTIWITHVLVWTLAMLSIYLFTRVAFAQRSERVELLRQIEFDAMHDMLTGLPNRRLFSDRVDHAVRRMSREGNFQFAVCFLDLDRFKNVNDSYGHQVGDELLVQVAKRFDEVLRPADSVARIGGDEFTFLLEGVKGVNEAVVISERILDSLDNPLLTEIGELYIKASVGVCMSSLEYTRAEDMLRDADIAMYRAKDEGKGCVDVFNQDMHEQARQVMIMENDLRHGLEREQLQIYYQPVVNIEKNHISGFEALLRWKHPDMGYVSPDIFVPVAEDTGLISEISEWVIKKASEVVHDWNLEFGRGHDMCLSVNLSARQLVQSDLAAKIGAILERSRFRSSLFHCEVTETAVMQDKERSARVIGDLKKRGYRISVDDFGKGYSSLTYLQAFDFTTLKIDKEFVQDMGGTGRGLQLVKTMMMLARDFDLNVVAEGVETIDQLNRLRALGCRMIQGYYFSRPLPENEIRELLVQGKHLDAGSLNDFDPLVSFNGS